MSTNEMSTEYGFNNPRFSFMARGALEYMAFRTREHITGDAALADTVKSFTKTGFSCNEILKDYGEDFFVVTHELSSGIVEPFRIFVQSKGTEPLLSAKARWTEYIDPLTVRNWVLANEMVVVVKRDMRSDEAKFCIPEEDYEYLDIHAFLFSENGPRLVPIKCNKPFEKNTPSELVWRARIRHYERLIRLCLPDNKRWNDLPMAYIYAIELLGRLGLTGNELLPTTAAIEHYALLPADGEYEDEPDMSIEEKMRFEKCCRLVVDRIAEVAPEYPLANACLEQCAIVLTKAFIKWESDMGR